MNKILKGHVSTHKAPVIMTNSTVTYLDSGPRVQSPLERYVSVHASVMALHLIEHLDSHPLLFCAVLA